MSVIYADASALARAYLIDEPEHNVLLGILLEGDDVVVTSELTRVELASAVRAALAAGRIRGPEDVLARIDLDLGGSGPVSVLRLRPESVIPSAHRLVLEHRLRTLDALHLAVALEECPAIAGDEEIVFVTRDRDQATAAEAVGFAVG